MYPANPQLIYPHLVFFAALSAFVKAEKTLSDIERAYSLSHSCGSWILQSNPLLWMMGGIGQIRSIDRAHRNPGRVFMALPQSISLTSSFGTGQIVQGVYGKVYLVILRDRLFLKFKTRSGNVTEGFSHRTGWSRSKDFW